MTVDYRRCVCICVRLTFDFSFIIFLCSTLSVIYEWTLHALIIIIKNEVLIYWRKGRHLTVCVRQDELHLDAGDVVYKCSLGYVSYPDSNK